MRATLARRTICLALAFASATATAAAPVPGAKPAVKTALIVTEIRLDIDATGRVTAAEPSYRLPVALKAAVIGQAKTWRFETPMRDGRPVAGTTYARTSVCAAENGQGGLALKMGEIHNGPGWDTKQFRHFFPPITNDVLALTKLEMDVVYDVSADGRAKLVSMATVPEKLRSQRQIEGAVKEWLASTRFQPEQLDGLPVATRMRMPITFTWEKESKSRKEAQREWVDSNPTCQALLGGGSEAKPAVALDSPFRAKPSS